MLAVQRPPINAAPLADAPSPGALDWARRLVRIHTVSDRSNLALIDTIADEMRGLGVPIRLTRDETGRKANLFATLGAGKPDGLVLSGHTDTVPWDGQAWTRDPLGADVDDGRLWGRGSADMKGFIGLVVAQTRRWLEADLPHAIHYAFSYDEEVGCFGVRHLIADLKDAGLAPRLCIVGEPTSMQPAVAHKGVYRWRCCVKGKPAHSSLTPMSVNAIEAAARLIAHLADTGDRWQQTEPPWPGFDVPWSTSSVGVIQGGIADNVVPEDCRFHYEFRNLPASDAEAMQADVEARAAELSTAMHVIDPASGFRFEPICAIPAFRAADDEPVVALVQSLLGTRERTLVAFGTEAGLFQAAGLSTVVCGPGSIQQAHQPDEHVTLEQLARCERMLQGLAGPA
jgi:acetylornithine deacetylase